MVHPGLAAALALVCAVLFATAAVVEHRVANNATVEPGRSAALRLILRLVRSRAWLAGQLCSAVGFVIHGMALRAGPVVLVQPILSFGLVITLVMGALVDRRHPGRPLPSRMQWASAAVVVAGLVLFLRSAHPRHGHGTGQAGLLMTGGLAVLVLGVAALAWNHRRQHRHRALALGIAAGCGFGMTGVLLKQVVHAAPTTWSTIWPLLLLLLCGATSIICAQSAYQAGALIESLPSLTVLEPVVAVVVASMAYGERLHPGMWWHGGQVAGMLLLAAGVTGIARAESRRHTPLSEALPDAPATEDVLDMPPSAGSRYV
jgi:drug/metabolite transporter (DMT)-like permease